VGKRSTVALVLACSACAVTPPTPSVEPPVIASAPSEAVAPPVVPPPRDPFEIPELLPDAPIPQEPAAFRSALVRAPLLSSLRIPAAPPTCESWTHRPRAKVAACDTPDTGRVALDWALDDRLGDESLDGRLASIEVCKGLDPGFVRAVRAERAPVECGDALAMPILEKPPVGLTGPIFHALYGYAIAAKAARIGAMTGARGAELLSSLEVAAADLPRSYGRAMALAGIATGWTKVSPPDTSLVDRASRVAVEAMGAEGIGDSYRLEPARGWLTVPFGWLAEIDVLQLPAAEPGPRGPPPAQPASLGKMPCRDCYDDHRRAFSLVERLAEDLPSFLGAYLLEEKELGSAEALRAFAGNGSLPARVRRGFEHAAPSTETRQAVARAHLTLGLQFFDRREVDTAISLLAAQPVADRPDSTRLLLALALALHGGPRDLSEWTREPVRPERFDLGALDVMAGSTVRDTRAVAEYDAGVLRELEAGAVAGELAALETQLHRYEVVLAQGWSPVAGAVKERAEALRFLLKQIEKDTAEPGYSAATPIRFEGWPRVKNESGAWFARHTGMTRVGTANRTGSVNRELRRLSYRFERCITASTAAHPRMQSAVGLRFGIDRSGSVTDAVAVADAPAGADLAACIAEVSRGLWFRQPDFGPWKVEVRFRVRQNP